MPKKGLVLDLDNTLWGGIVGEDGKENLRLSLAPPGNSYLAFQQAILDLYHRGVLLAINSRNNPEDALDVIRTHPNMILKEQHFAAMRINWKDKAENLRDIAKELNIGLDSLVFLDDDPTNRELVRALVPEVETPDLPSDPSLYARFLHSLKYFPKEAITDEDKMRGNLYVTERLRREEEKHYESKEEFLKNLHLELLVHVDDATHLARLAQLTEKTNQFNTDKHPLTEAEIKHYIESPKHKVFYARLQDKFGDHGIIFFALVETNEAAWNISSMLMSCRVFDRGVEDAMLGVILEQAKKAGATEVSVTFAETPKNAPAKQFVDVHFKNYKAKVPPKAHIPEWITIQYENI